MQTTDARTEMDGGPLDDAAPEIGRDRQQLQQQQQQQRNFSRYNTNNYVPQMMPQNSKFSVLRNVLLIIWISLS